MWRRSTTPDGAASRLMAGISAWPPASSLPPGSAFFNSHGIGDCGGTMVGGEYICVFLGGQRSGTVPGSGVAALPSLACQTRPPSPFHVFEHFAARGDCAPLQNVSASAFTAAHTFWGEAGMVRSLLLMASHGVRPPAAIRRTACRPLMLSGL